MKKLLLIKDFYSQVLNDFHLSAHKLLEALYNIYNFIPIKKFKPRFRQ